jgi:hypothetical protein
MSDETRSPEDADRFEPSSHWMAATGQKGGRSRSQRKVAAVRASLAKARQSRWPDGVPRPLPKEPPVGAALKHPPTVYMRSCARCGARFRTQVSKKIYCSSKCCQARQHDRWLARLYKQAGRRK